ncbi:hypothetical protein L2E82_31791 [Cichorium intybus]|uniref:Uncharacterized protein n=1 Tax=Cichorium intybus TaxID=13427 RepID=A0ACB9BEI8_CICIN|nr:hypothetical protein L2E82_31791 [Cichorium intybus]
MIVHVHLPFSCLLDLVQLFVCHTLCTRSSSLFLTSSEKLHREVASNDLVLMISTSNGESSSTLCFFILPRLHLFLSTRIVSSSTVLFGKKLGNCVCVFGDLIPDAR